jgi:hypothetical protein
LLHARKDVDARVKPGHDELCSRRETESHAAEIE